MFALIWHYGKKSYFDIVRIFPTEELAETHKKTLQEFGGGNGLSIIEVPHFEI